MNSEGELWWEHLPIRGQKEIASRDARISKLEEALRWAAKEFHYLVCSPNEEEHDARCDRARAALGGTP